MVSRSQIFRGIRLCFGGVCAGIAGCASDRLAEPAGDAARYVSAFQVDLATLQTDVADYQKQAIAINGERVTDTSRSLATATQAEDVMLLLACTTPGAVFSALQTQGNASLAIELAAAPSTPAAATLPTDKLAAVASSLTSLSKKPGSKENLDFLLAYGQSVGASLKTPTAGATTPASGTNAPPAKKGATP
jgi:succinylglutamate desuccinylase